VWFQALKRRKVKIFFVLVIIGIINKGVGVAAKMAKLVYYLEKRYGTMNTMNFLSRVR
jgi:hypothetical protein